MWVHPVKLGVCFDVVSLKLRARWLGLPCDLDCCIVMRLVVNCFSGGSPMNMPLADDELCLQWPFVILLLGFHYSALGCNCDGAICRVWSDVGC
ncbi:hypothetical protein Nepgr_008073 [Nepenthes gracilis]|uniref:Uncharacterized protein n=1 Tax=Nepenthes gracilis TaxID=150966 RepID=A0AAD3S856_NEPGR|nr:hypothetical protein Nepgr_008073 [Nepenthes gracilis]